MPGFHFHSTGVPNQNMPAKQQKKNIIIYPYSTILTEKIQKQNNTIFLGECSNVNTSGRAVTAYLMKDNCPSTFSQTDPQMA